MAEQDEVAKPTMSPLAHLTSQSAAFGQWEVLIFSPDAQEREYIYQKKKRTAYNFRCLLVSTQEIAVATREARDLPKFLKAKKRLTGMS